MNNSPFLNMEEGRATARNGSELVLGIFDALAKYQAIPKVFPAYIARRIRTALQGEDPEAVIAEVGETQTIGDCKYATQVTDFNGTKYRVTVEVML